MEEKFEGNFTQQEPIPEAAIEAAISVMRHGRLHRYNVQGAEESEAEALEREFAAWQGAKYCVAVASGGYAIGLALRTLDVKPSEPVLTNAFTLAPVPGAIAALGARPVFVGTTPELTIDFDDLEDQIDKSGARILLLSHMRGHICDMDRLMAICDGAGVQVIEDCAHTMGAKWAGVRSGQHGRIACFSTQTYKHMNSGEGGFLTTDDPEIAARAILMSGSYMFFDRHGAAPEPDQAAEFVPDTPNISGRMDNLRAAILRVQLRSIDDACVRWNARYTRIEKGLRDVSAIQLIHRPQAEFFVGSSIQFRLNDLTSDQVKDFISRCKKRGVELKWFGANDPAGFTSTYRHWNYADPQALEKTDQVLFNLMDMRIPLTFSLEDCEQIARIIAQEAQVSGENTVKLKQA